MRVSILGAGAIAYGLAAYLANSGHSPSLWSPSGQRTKALAAGDLLKATGDIEATVPVRIARDCKDAVANADVVVIALPAYGHKMVMDAAIPHLTDGIPVIISSHCSFAALYLSRRLAERKVSLPIVVWGTTLLTGRQLGPTEVHVTTIRQKLDVATLPFKPRMKDTNFAQPCSMIVSSSATGCLRSRSATSIRKIIWELRFLI